MKLRLSFLISAIFLLLAMTFNACKTYPPTDLARNTLIPRPVSVVATGRTFELTSDAVIYVDEGAEELMPAAHYLAGLLKPATGFGLEVQSTPDEPAGRGIYLTLNNTDNDLGREGYDLTISEELVKLTAVEPAGVVHGIQTLRQLLPAIVEAGSKQEGPWLIPTGTIRDFPRYAYRGVMLDVSRHFFEVEEVKRLIDQLAMYKMNTLHLHLTDDQGWRIEIKSWPNLTQHGAATQVGGGEGGFYTQEEYREIVQYAADRYITIVPEVDMPGHTNAALASYPELTCDGKAPELYTGTKVGFSSLCVRKEIVYEFVDDVVREISEMTPGPFFHIGGDESHSTKEEDYIYFVNRVQEIVQSHGKRVIGWDEIALATLIDDAVVQYWSKDQNALKGVEQGAKVIMSPARRAYLDMKYDSTTVLGLNWAGYIEVDHGYTWDPASMVEDIDNEDILGVEAPLWTETVTNTQEMDQLVFPRLMGYAEIGWTQPALRNWEEYRVRLGKQKQRLDVLGIKYYESVLVPWEDSLDAGGEQE